MNEETLLGNEVSFSTHLDIQCKDFHDIRQDRHIPRRRLLQDRLHYFHRLWSHTWKSEYMIGKDCQSNRSYRHTGCWVHRSELDFRIQDCKKQDVMQGLLERKVG